MNEELAKCVLAEPVQGSVPQWLGLYITGLWTLRKVRPGAGPEKTRQLETDAGHPPIILFTYTVKLVLYIARLLPYCM